MTTTAPPTFTPGEGVTETNGLIHGISVPELHALGESVFAAKTKAYCPYSLFRVGASLLLVDQDADNNSDNNNNNNPSPALITGANVENAAYPVGTCAERVALGTAVHAGHTQASAFKALAVATDIADFCSPCGMCRQFLREFLPLACPVFMFNRDGVFIVRTMEELLPLSFGPDVLPPREKLRATTS